MKRDTRSSASRNSGSVNGRWVHRCCARLESISPVKKGGSGAREWVTGYLTSTVQRSLCAIESGVRRNSGHAHAAEYQKAPEEPSSRSECKETGERHGNKRLGGVKRDIYLQCHRCSMLTQACRCCWR